MKRKDILIILVLLFIFILTWIISNIWHSAVSSTISESTNKDISPIEAAFDTKTIDKLKERSRVTPFFELSGITPTPIALPTLIISPKKTPEEEKLLL